MDRKTKNVSDYRRRRKENLVQVCGGKCCLCGYNKNIAALEFHHLIPEEKNYSIGNQGVCHDLQDDLKEVKKCILVCSNCHREIHHGDYQLKEILNKQQFDEKEAQNLIVQKEQQYITTKYYCIDCGKEITRDSKTGRCVECAQKARRVSVRPNRQELKNLIRTTPFVQIGKQFNVSDNTIRKWCDKEKLPRHTNEIKSYSDEEWEKI